MRGAVRCVQSCVWRHVVCAFACSYLQRSLAQKRSLKLCPKRSCVCCVCAPAHARAAPYTHTPQSACAEGTRAHPASRAGTSLRRTLPHRCKMPGTIDPLCPATAPFFGFMGAAVALIFASASPPTQPAALARAPASHQRTGGDAPAACVSAHPRWILSKVVPRARDRCASVGLAALRRHCPSPLAARPTEPPATQADGPLPCAPQTWAPRTALQSLALGCRRWA